MSELTNSLKEEGRKDKKGFSELDFVGREKK